MITLELDEMLPSLNRMRGRGEHWSSWQREKNKWVDLVLVARNKQKIFVPPVYTRVRIEIDRICHALITDDDNLHASTKHLMDALVLRGLIKDDNRDVVVEKVITQIKVKRAEKQRTVVRIFPLTAQSVGSDVPQFGVSAHSKEDLQGGKFPTVAQARQELAGGADVLTGVQPNGGPSPVTSVPRPAEPTPARTERRRRRQSSNRGGLS